jgi:SAM-dependent methyltransferase
LLDAGCGQGFFTSLFAECGLDALGVDISVQGIKQATANHGPGGAQFAVGDVCNLPCAGAFDCVYTRSCSLYNESNFAEDRHITEALLKYVKPGGVLIFDYYTNLCPRKKSEAWIYHSMAATKQHFAHYSGSKVFFSLRLDTVVLGSFAFSLSRANAMASRISGLGGDLIAIVPKC